MCYIDGPGRICTKDKEPVVEELKMIPISFQQPFCHNTAMLPVFTYRDESKGLFRQFRCQICKHVDSRLVAVPNKRKEAEVKK